jgi:hypothetical protein
MFDGLSTEDADALERILRGILRRLEDRDDDQA